MSYLNADPYELRLYIAGETARSRRAVDNIKRVCEMELQGTYSLRIIDVLDEPHLAEEVKIVATPTLIKVAPSPSRRIIGDLSNSENVRLGLDIMLEG